MKTYPESYHSTVRSTCNAFVDLALVGKNTEAKSLLLAAEIPYAHFMFYLIRTYMGSGEEQVLELANTAYGKPEGYDFHKETQGLFA